VSSVPSPRGARAAAPARGDHAEHRALELAHHALVAAVAAGGDPLRQREAVGALGDELQRRAQRFVRHVSGLAEVAAKERAHDDVEGELHHLAVHVDLGEGAVRRHAALEIVEECAGVPTMILAMSASAAR